MDYPADRPAPRGCTSGPSSPSPTPLWSSSSARFVTSFRVGMADPIWPTEPWYLATNFKVDFGYLVEHFHRIVAWSIGVLGLVLTFGLRSAAAGVVVPLGSLVAVPSSRSRPSTVFGPLQSARRGYPST